VLGGISIKVIKLMKAILALSLLFVACGSAIDYGTPSESPTHGGNAYYEGQAGYGHDSSHGHGGDQHNWMDNDHDWLSPGGSYSSYWWYPSTYYYDWYYTPTYTYTYYPTYYYTTPVYYNTPVVYHSWDMDPWWGANVYGYWGTTHYSSSYSWTYGRGFGF
jgi:hypothetical protein